MEKTTRCRACDREFTYEYTGGRLRYYCNVNCRPSSRPPIWTTCSKCGGTCRHHQDFDRSPVCGACRPKRVERTCAACKKVFKRPPSSPRRFCSPECRKGVRPRFERREVDCAICDATFTAEHPRQKWCPTCVENGADRSRARRYNISRADLAALKAKYGGLCWICRRIKGECVDHDHTTGQVRGYLCRGCNMALHFVERPEWWGQATAYLTTRR